ncbi:MAG: family 43 glycosylhydrolase [Bacteroidales bacterium]|nr:family 43 glycosylhydrolase [Bacteroidales bacterium]
MKFKSLILIFLLTVSSMLSAQTPVNNPLLPGYFADPTIKQFGDTFYIYSTTDGVKLASGEPTVWVSRDLQNWYNHELDIKLPDGLTNCWAPDVVFRNGKYYYFMGNCQFGCNIYGYVSDSPLGPFVPINNGDAVIPVGTAKKDLPALDAQYFVDDDGSVYSYFGTWCTSFGGLGWAKINPDDMTTIIKTGIIPTQQLPKVFEAAYMLKRNGKYILMYSSGDCRLSSYAVHYAWADSPEGPFHYGVNNPILETQSGVDSPGHHSVIKIQDRYYIVYHRHDIPHSSGGETRQVCINGLKFLSDTIIEKVDVNMMLQSPINQHVKPLPVASVTATSFYHLKASKNRFNTEDIDFKYLPEFAADNSNATMWKAKTANYPQSITYDMGSEVTIKRIETCFEYSTYFYQYKIEVSNDNKTWKIFADRTQNRRAGSPMIDDDFAKARYVKLTVTGTEKTGLFPAVFRMSVYSDTFEYPDLPSNKQMNEHSVASTNSLLVDFDLSKAKTVKGLVNKGTLGGNFIGKQKVIVYKGKRCVYFDGHSKIVLSKKAPQQLSWNGAFTVSVDVLNPEIGEGECLVSWTSRDNMLMSSYAALYYGTSNYGAMAHGDGYVDLGYSKLPQAGEWHNIKVTFDGMIEKIYVDGVLNRELPLMLFVEPSDIIIGTSGEPWEFFSGYISDVKIWDYCFD